MKDSLRGFTLIELMIVVAIIGVVASVALPFYQDYILRTQVTRAVAELSSYRAAVDAQLSRSGTFSNNALGYSPSSLTTGSQASDIAFINPDGSGHLEVTMGVESHPDLSGLTIRFLRDVDGGWQCVINPASASGWRDSLSPDLCLVL